MNISKNNFLLNSIISFKQRKTLVDEYNLKSGEYLSESLVFAKPLIEKSKIFTKLIKKKNLHKICPDQFSIFNYNHFLFYFVFRFVMLFIGLPFLLFSTIRFYFVELYNQYKFMKEKMKSGEYSSEFESIHMTPCRFFFQSFMSPVGFFINFFFGFVFERWASSFIPLFISLFLHSLIIIINIFLIAFLASISLFLLLYHFYLLIKENSQRNVQNNDKQKNKNSIFTKLFKDQIDIK